MRHPIRRLAGEASRRSVSTPTFSGAQRVAGPNVFRGRQGPTMRIRTSGVALTGALLLAGLLLPASASARGWAVTPPSPVPANTNLVVCADGGGGPVVADGPNFRTVNLTAGHCIAWSVHEGQYNVGLQYSLTPSTPELSYIKVFRPGGQGATFAPPTVATHVAPFPANPSLGPTSNGIPTGESSGSHPINVTVVVLQFGPGGPGGTGGGSSGGGGGDSDANHNFRRPGQHPERNSSHLCGALARETPCHNPGPF
jgi:hypothetical protein